MQHDHTYVVIEIIKTYLKPFCVGSSPLPALENMTYIQLVHPHFAIG